MPSRTPTPPIEAASFTELPAATWRKIRALYQGTDREVAGDRNCEAIRVRALAVRFNVHPNTIYTRASNRLWQRPAWYGRGGCVYPQGTLYRKGHIRDAALLARLVAIAETGAPCPSNVDLATEFKTSPPTIVISLGRLKASKRITIENATNRRRITIASTGKQTGWTVRRTPAPVVILAPVVAAIDSKPKAPPRMPLHPSGRTTRRLQKPMVDGPVRDAQLYLMRAGVHVWDTGVLRKGPEGFEWSVDGAIVDAAGLREIASQRRVKEMQGRA